MKKRDDIYLSQIQQRVAQIKKYLKGISRERFLKSDLHKSAVVRELEVIGEAASWEEAVADYKGYLRKKKDFRLQTGMTKFNSTFKHLNEIGDGK